jgi:hypothetical protein
MIDTANFSRSSFAGGFDLIAEQPESEAKGLPRYSG